MSGVFGEFNQAWIRAVMAIILLIPLGLITKGFRKIARADWKWFIVIALSGGLNQAPYFFGFEHLYIGTATLLFYLMLTLGMFLFGKFFFGEKLTPVKYFSLVLAVIGLTIIYKFVLTPDQILPALSTMIAGLLGASGVVFTKKLSTNYSETQILLSYFVAMLPINLVLSLVFKESTPAITLNNAWLGQLCYLFAHLSANAAVIAGVKRLEPSIAGLIGLLEVVFAAGLGVWFFGETLTNNLLIGSGVILLAAGLPDLIKVFQKQTH